MAALPEDHWLVGVRPQPVTAEEYEALPEEISKMIEVIDGHVVFCESPTIEHQKAVWRLANLLERAAKAAVERGRACLDVNFDVDVRLQDVPLSTRRPDVVLHKCLDRRGKDPKDKERLRAEHALLVVEIVSPGSEFADTTDKLGEYARVGIPHYWIVRLDDTGAAIIERYRLDTATRTHKHIETLIKEEAGGPPEIGNPIPMAIDWSELEY